MASKVKYTLDLPSIFDRAYEDKGIIFRSLLRPTLSQPDVKRSIGERVIERIRQRTQEDGVDKNNRPLKKYAKSYVKSLPFQIYGKSKDDVNLTLTGEMLSSMRPVIKFTGRQLIIEFADKFNNDKAHGHINGANNLPVRDFFGLPSDDEVEILKEVVDSFSLQSALTDIDALISALRGPAVQVGNQDFLLGNDEEN